MGSEIKSVFDDISRQTSKDRSKGFVILFFGHDSNGYDRGHRDRASFCIWVFWSHGIVPGSIAAGLTLLKRRW